MQRLLEWLRVLGFCVGVLAAFGLLGFVCVAVDGCAGPPDNACVSGPTTVEATVTVTASGGDLVYDEINTRTVGKRCGMFGTFASLTPQADGTWEARYEHPVVGTTIRYFKACPPPKR